MKFTYKDINDEYENVLEQSACDNIEDTIVSLICNLTDNKILKDQLFLITLYPKNNKNDIDKHIYKACKPNEIVDVLDNYKDDNMGFFLKLFERN